MAQYIDKSALVAELNKRLQERKSIKPSKEDDFGKGYLWGRDTEDEAVLYFIDTLEVKEVDIEDAKKEELAKEYVDYTFKRYNIDANSKEGQLIYYAYIHGMNKCLNQLKAQKGE